MATSSAADSSEGCPLMHPDQTAAMNQTIGEGDGIATDKPTACSEDIEGHTYQTTNYTADKGFAIAELPETILIQLPTRDLLLSQRVSRIVQATIKDSLKLQQALFLSPMPDTSFAAGNLVTRNPLFKGWARLAFRFLMPKRRETWFDYMSVDHILPSTPLAKQTSRTIMTDFSRFGGRADDAAWILKTSQPGSWQNMYVSQPPRPIAVTFPVDRSDKRDRLPDTVWRCRGMNGLKLREILEDVERHIAEAKLTDQEYAAELQSRGGYVFHSDS